MEIAQAQLQLVIHHLKQVEERIAMQREKIASQLARGQSTVMEEEQLGSLLRALDILKTHLATVIDPVKGD